MFRDLRVVGLGASVSYQPTLGSIFNPSHIVETIQNVRHPPVRDILNGFEGVVKPGEMLRRSHMPYTSLFLLTRLAVVLGRPGSGCSTLLKILANQRGGYHAVEGEVHYDSISPEDLQKHYRGDVQYCPEDDLHFPTLTVDQTLKFAATTRVPQARLDHSRKQFTTQLTDILITIFGLGHARRTPVGDAAIRGVSGGERKRISIAEALATRPRIGAWDKYVCRSLAILPVDLPAGPL